MKRIKNGKSSINAGIVFTLPLIIGLIVFFLPTVIEGIQFAFSKVDISAGLSLDFIGLQNFKYALAVDAGYIRTALSDLQNLITTLPVIIVFSLFTAVLLNSKVWGRGIFRAIFFLPVIACVGMLASVQSGLTTQTMESAVSSETQAISAISDVKSILQNMNFSPELINIVSGAADNIFNIVNRSGVQILIFLAGIQSISPSVYESANVEGASAWEIFWKITLPMISPMIVVNILFTFVDSITRDDTAIMKYIKNMAFTRGEFGYSSAMAWFHYLLLLILLGLVFAVIFIGKGIARKGRENA